jgi:hypothetical protein
MVLYALNFVFVGSKQEDIILYWMIANIPLPLWLNRAFWDQLIVYYQQMHLMLILFNLKCLKQ